MLVTRTSAYSGKTTSLDLPISEEDLQKWERGEVLIQDIFSHLTPDQREFLMTGMTSEEWDALFLNMENDE
jgi:hypothetical protein